MALGGLAESLWQATGAELGAVMTVLDELCTLAAAGRVAVAREALTRGEVATSQAGSLAAWIAERAPSLAVTGGCAQVAAVVEAGNRVATAPVTAAACAGRVPVPVAVAVIREIEKLRPRLVPEAVPTVVEAMLTVGAAYGVRAVREVRARLLAEHGEPGALQREQDAASALVSLSAAVGDELGAFTYHLTLDAEGKAVLEAAIGPLSAPTPAPDGSRDRRPARMRRGLALIEVCRRATAAGGGLPSGPKATLMVMMSWEQLRDRLGAGRVVGSTAAELLLGPETVRRVACDARLVPAVLGGAGEVLDVGQTVRLFTQGQLKALWLRDRSCTFPGCGTPAHWCDAHHVRHWADGGTTSLGNAALLCGRHHTIVHRDRLVGAVVGGEVVWDRVPGSYDRALAGWIEQESGGSPPAGTGPGSSPPMGAGCGTWSPAGDGSASSPPLAALAAR